VVTIHDAIPWNGQDTAWSPGFYRDWLLPAAYHKATAVLTDSNSSRRDILARWPKLQPKLHVVSLGVHERYFEAEPESRAIQFGDRVVDEPYLLYLGGSEPRKRLNWALQAWWGCGVPGVSFVVCGLERAAHDTVRRMTPAEFQDRLILAPFIPEDLMPRVYMRAAAVLYPTLYEGFGLPVVEAQAVGTPVLFSDVGSLTELKGPGAIVLPVDDLAAWSRAVSDVVRSHAASRSADGVARAWAKQYSWDSHINRTLAVYQAAAARTIRSRANTQCDNQA
jgi:glycosyltransferase involved in cell wall biosynthesis